eukprot:m.290173 g.290173  ORF g.290173 m.290173 type:complete len:312 (+) comp27121_c0_seq1:1236-2171(+)
MDVLAVIQRHAIPYIATTTKRDNKPSGDAARQGGPNVRSQFHTRTRTHMHTKRTHIRNELPPNEGTPCTSTHHRVTRSSRPCISPSRVKSPDGTDRWHGMTKVRLKHCGLQSPPSLHSNLSAGDNGGTGARAGSNAVAAVAVVGTARAVAGGVGAAPALVGTVARSSISVASTGLWRAGGQPTTASPPPDTLVAEASAGEGTLISPLDAGGSGDGGMTRTATSGALVALDVVRAGAPTSAPDAARSAPASDAVDRAAQLARAAGGGAPGCSRCVESNDCERGWGGLEPVEGGGGFHAVDVVNGWIFWHPRQ